MFDLFYNIEVYSCEALYSYLNESLTFVRSKSTFQYTFQHTTESFAYDSYSVTHHVMKSRILSLSLLHNVSRDLLQIHTWNYSLFWLIFFIFIQQLFDQIKLQQNLQLNELFNQSVYFFWAADETFDVHSVCMWICYLISYFSKTETMCYHMCCSFSCSAALTDRRFYFRHSHLV